MDKQAYFKLMGLNKIALGDPAIQPDTDPKVVIGVPDVKAPAGKAPAKKNVPSSESFGPRIPEKNTKDADDFVQYVQDTRNPWSTAQKYFMTPELRNQMGKTMERGVPHMLTASRLVHGGELNANQAFPVFSNMATKETYESQSFWHRLWQFIKQKWAAITGDYDYMSSGERPVAMRAKQSYQNAKRNLRLLTGNQQ